MDGMENYWIGLYAQWRNRAPEPFGQYRPLKYRPTPRHALNNYYTQPGSPNGGQNQNRGTGANDGT